MIRGSCLQKNGVVSEHAVCSGNFGKNNGTDLEECCCYGEGCNGKDVGEPLKDLADGKNVPDTDGADTPCPFRFESPFRDH